MTIQNNNNKKLCFYNSRGPTDTDRRAEYYGKTKKKKNYTDRGDGGGRDEYYDNGNEQ